MIRLDRFSIPPLSTARTAAGALVSPMSILAVGAHPDDIEFGCGATLNKFAAYGHRVTMLVMTRGEVGGAAETRQRELLDSAAVLGVSEVALAPFEDTNIPLTKEVITAIEEVVREISATMVFVNDPHDTHQDHRTTAECVQSATRYVRNVLYYEVPSTQQFTPEIFVDVASQLDVKRRALLAHTSQVHKVNIADLTILECAEANAVFRGVQGKVKRAEAFKALRLFINI